MIEAENHYFRRGLSPLISRLYTCRGEMLTAPRLQDRASDASPGAYAFTLLPEHAMGVYQPTILFNREDSF